MQTNSTVGTSTEAARSLVVQRDRPFGVTAIAFLQVGASATAIFRWWESGPIDSGFSDPAVYLNSLSAGVAFTGVILAVGLLAMVRWAWPLALFILSVQLGVGLWAYYQDHPGYLTMIFSVAAIFYLNSRDVRDAFGYVRARESLPIE